MRQQINTLQARQLNGLNSVQPVVVSPNFKTTRLVGVQPQAVQIYNVPRIVGPGVVGSIAHIRY